MSSFVQSCYGFYTLTTEDKTSWNIPGWIPLDDPLEWQNISYLSSVCPEPWRYVGKNTLNTGLSRANFGDYGGGGFVAELGYDQETALKASCLVNKIAATSVNQYCVGTISVTYLQLLYPTCKVRSICFLFK